MLAKMIKSIYYISHFVADVGARNVTKVRNVIISLFSDQPSLGYMDVR